MHQCQQCRKEHWNWKNCSNIPDWFGPEVICYCPYQVEFILRNLSLLKSGRWPPEGVETGYYDTGGQKIRRGNAYYEIPICVASDVETRLDKCGKDGTLTRKCLSDGWDEYTLSELMGKPMHVIEKKIHNVVWYCSGARTRRITYYEFTRRRGIADANIRR